MRRPPDSVKRCLVVLAVLLLPAGMILLHLGKFPFPSGSAFSDFAVSHYPNALFLKQSVMRYGEIPYWSNTILSGYPFAANPLSGVWYPPGWLALALPLPAGLNAAVVLHLLWGGLGMFRLLQARGAAFPAALTGAVVFVASPKIFAHFAAGHVTLLYAVAWTPWLLLAETRAKHGLLPGVVLGLILLADVRWALPAGLIWAAWKLNLVQEQAGRGEFLVVARRFSVAFFLNALIAVLVAAPLLILLAEYASLTTRAGLSLGEQLALSLPPESLLGLLAPDFAAYAEWVTYFGALPLVLLVYALAVPAVRKRSLFWIGVLAVSILVSLGSAVPGLERLWALPGFSLLRVPSRLMFLGSVAFAFLTTFSLDELLARRPLTRPDPVFWMTPLAAFAWLLAIGLWALTGEFSKEFLWAAVALTLAIVLIVLRQRTAIANAAWAGAVLAVLLLDLTGVNALNLRFDPPETVLTQGAAGAGVFQPADSPYRVYSPSYSLPQQTAALLGLELADGVDPLQLASYAEFFDAASGIERAGYSVTLPPDPLETAGDNPRRARPDTGRLGLLNVRYLAAAYPLESPGLTLLYSGGGLYIYENQNARPRAWVQNGEQLVSQREQTLPVITHRSPNRIALTADGPGMLVLSEVMYPGWEVYVDGQEATVTLVEGLLRGVVLPDGNHQVRFQFTPRGLHAGIALALIGWLIVFAAGRGIPFRIKRVEPNADQ